MKEHKGTQIQNPQKKESNPKPNDPTQPKIMRAGWVGLPTILGLVRLEN